MRGKMMSFSHAHRIMEEHFPVQPYLLSWSAHYFHDLFSKCHLNSNVCAWKLQMSGQIKPKLRKYYEKLFFETLDLVEKKVGKTAAKYGISITGLLLFHVTAILYYLVPHELCIFSSLCS